MGAGEAPVQGVEIFTILAVHCEFSNVLQFPEWITNHAIVPPYEEGKYALNES